MTHSTNASLLALMKSRSEFPLRAFLLLYSKAHAKDVYCNHFEGTKLLVNWLGPIETDKSNPHTSHLLMNYEVTKLAEHLSSTPSAIWNIIFKEFQNGNLINR